MTAESIDEHIASAAASRRKRQLRKKRITALGLELEPFLRSYISAALVPVLASLRDREKKLGLHLAAVERAMEYTMQFRGVWDHRTYTRGEAVTHDGGVWLAMDSTDSKPGTDDTWKLTVKRGAFTDDKPRGKADR